MKKVTSSGFRKIAKKKDKKSGDDYDPNPWAVCHTTVVEPPPPQGWGDSTDIASFICFCIAKTKRQGLLNIL